MQVTMAELTPLAAEARGLYAAAAVAGDGAARLQALQLMVRINVLRQAVRRAAAATTSPAPGRNGT